MLTSDMYLYLLSHKVYTLYVKLYYLNAMHSRINHVYGSCLQHNSVQHTTYLLAAPLCKWQNIGAWLYFDLKALGSFLIHFSMEFRRFRGLNAG